jgi:hypothetical protein
VKSSGRNESVQIVIYMCMETMLGISLYSYPYLKLAKCYVFLIIACLLFNKIGEEGRTGSSWKLGEWRGESGKGLEVMGWV